MWPFEKRKTRIDLAPGQSVEFTFSPDNPSDKTPNDTFHSTAAKLRTRELEYRKEVAEWMLENYNNNWREANDPALSSDQFAKRIRLNAVNIFSDNTLTLFYDDGGLFAGHFIVAHIHPNGDVDLVDLFG